MSAVNGSGQPDVVSVSGMEGDGRSSDRPDGASARNYLNENVVPHLLEGVRMLAVNQ